MKRIFIVISVMVLLASGCSHSDSIKIQDREFTRLTDTKLYINDEVSSLAVYESDQSEKYVPLRESLAEMGYATEDIEQNMLIVETPGVRNVCMRFQDGEIEHRVVTDGDYSFVNEAWKSYRSPMQYITENNMIYYPLEELSIAVGCYEYRDSNTIYLDSEEYYKENHTICQNIGRKVNVTAYINDTKTNSPVYYNTMEADIEGNTLGFFVELGTVFEAIGAKAEYTAPNSVIVTHGNLQYTFRAERVYEDGKELRFDDADDDCYIVDGKTYVKFSTIRVKTDGVLSQADEHNMHVYLPGFERQDIPKTLQEAYVYLDENLNEDDIEFMKDCTYDELATTHFGLGRWIRNNWLNGSEIEKIFNDKGITEFDDMSGYIIAGYKAYLNGQSCEIEDLIK